MDIQGMFAKVPTWGWVVGGAGVIGAAYFLTRSSSASAGGTSSQLQSALDALNGALGNLGGSGSGSSSGGGGGLSGGSPNDPPGTPGATSTSPTSGTTTTSPISGSAGSSSLGTVGTKTIISPTGAPTPVSGLPQRSISPDVLGSAAVSGFVGSYNPGATPGTMSAKIIEHQRQGDVFGTMLGTQIGPTAVEQQKHATQADVKGTSAVKSFIAKYNPVAAATPSSQSAKTIEHQRQGDVYGVPAATVIPSQANQVHERSAAANPELYAGMTSAYTPPATGTSSPSSAGEAAIVRANILRANVSSRDTAAIHPNAVSAVAHTSPTPSVVTNPVAHAAIVAAHGASLPTAHPVVSPPQMAARPAKAAAHKAQTDIHHTTTTTRNKRTVVTSKPAPKPAPRPTPAARTRSQAV